MRLGHGLPRGRHGVRAMCRASRCVVVPILTMRVRGLDFRRAGRFVGIEHTVSHSGSMPALLSSLQLAPAAPRCERPRARAAVCASAQPQPEQSAAQPRRRLLLATAGTLAPALLLAGCACAESDTRTGRIAKTDAEWRSSLDGNSYRVLRSAWTEPPWSSPGVLCGWTRPRRTVVRTGSDGGGGAPGIGLRPQWASLRSAP